MLNKNIIDKYEDTRNFPALDSTSRVGVHLRFGTLSLRKIVNKSSNSFNNTYLKELIWREFLFKYCGIILIHKYLFKKNMNV